MKSHSRACAPPPTSPADPCVLSHSYNCKGCAVEFSVDGSTQYTDGERGRVWPLSSWPFHSLGCYVRYLGTHSDYTFRKAQFQQLLKDEKHVA